MNRDRVDVTPHVYVDGRHIVLRLNRDNFRMNAREAIRIADQLVDTAEQTTKETP